MAVDAGHREVEEHHFKLELDHHPQSIDAAVLGWERWLRICSSSASKSAASRLSSTTRTRSGRCNAELNAERRTQQSVRPGRLGHSCAVIFWPANRINDSAGGFQQLHLQGVAHR